MRGNGKLLYMKLENLLENTKKLEGNGSKTGTGRLELAISYVVKQCEADCEKKVCLRGNRFSCTRGRTESTSRAMRFLRERFCENRHSEQAFGIERSVLRDCTVSS